MGHMAYRIADWGRYEVDNNGRAWEESKAKRKAPLAFVRCKVYGFVQGDSQSFNLPIAVRTFWVDSN